MPPVKGVSSTTRNAVKGRLLQLAGLLKSTHEEATLALVERAFGLPPGRLKDQVKQGSISKPLARTLIEREGRAGITGLTMDWLVDGRGAHPRKGGKTPPSSPVAGRQGSQATGGGPELAGLDGSAGAGVRVGIGELAKEEALAMLTSALARAVHRTFVEPDSVATRQAREALADALVVFAREIQKGVGVDAGDILDVAIALRKGLLT